MKKSPAALLLATSIVTLLGITAASATATVITSDTPGGWVFSNIDNPVHNASGGFVPGPGTPPLGDGSARFAVDDAASSEILILTTLQPAAVSTLETLSYSTYVTTSTMGSGSAPTLQFDLFSGKTYEGRLVFDPGLLLSTVDGTWQDWDAVTSNAWYIHSNTIAGCTLAGPTYCSLSDATSILDALGVDYVDVLFKAGSGQASFLGNVDAFNFNDTLFDFEASVPEPLTLSLFGAGLAGAIVLGRRRKQTKA